MSRSFAYGAPAAYPRSSRPQAIRLAGQAHEYRGRKELVKSVLSALPTYLLTEVKPPRKFYTAMDKFREKIPVG
jgi:hypothetical protein